MGRPLGGGPAGTVDAGRQGDLGNRLVAAYISRGVGIDDVSKGALPLWATRAGLRWRAGEDLPLPLPGLPTPNGEQLQHRRVLRTGHGQHRSRNTAQLRTTVGQRVSGQISFLRRMRVQCVLGACAAPPSHRRRGRSVCRPKLLSSGTIGLDKEQTPLDKPSRRDGDVRRQSTASPSTRYRRGMNLLAA